MFLMDIHTSCSLHIVSPLRPYTSDFSATTLRPLNVYHMTILLNVIGNQLPPAAFSTQQLQTPQRSSNRNQQGPLFSRPPQMAQKRSRAAFEADGNSRFALYGTPIQNTPGAVGDQGAYVPIWKQDAVDERGRKRFHGAFTGGFSAG